MAFIKLNQIEQYEMLELIMLTNKTLAIDCKDLTVIVIELLDKNVVHQSNNKRCSHHVN